MNIIPKPQSISEYNGSLILSSNTIIEGDFQGVQDILRGCLSQFNHSVNNKVVLEKDTALEREEYIIEIKDDILIKSNSESGAFYASQSIIQLLRGGNIVPQCRIEDKPKYCYRGFMLDVARHYSSIENIKRILDVMGNLKMNYFHWHLTEDQGWRAEIKKYPLLTEKGAIRSSTPLASKGCFLRLQPRERKEYGRGLFYTQDEMRDIVDYASKRHIQVIPEIDMPGHLVSAIACYPNLSCNGKQVKVSNRWGILNNIACCGKEDIYKFVKDVIDELIEIFPCKYFHIGGDEAPKLKWKFCPKCQSKIKILGLRNEEELQGYFNNEIAEYLKSKGRIMIGWNEILDSADLLDKNIIAQWWKKRKNDKNEMKWINKGGKLLLSISQYVYMDYPYAVNPLSKTYSFSSKVLGVNDSNIIGVEAPLWTEYVRSKEKLDLNTYARLIAMSEVGWTNDNIKNYDDFEERLEYLREYFESYGLKIAPQEIYRGNTVKSLLGKIKGGRKKFRINPNFELKAANKGRKIIDG